MCRVSPMSRILGEISLSIALSDLFSSSIMEFQQVLCSSAAMKHFSDPLVRYNRHCLKQTYAPCAVPPPTQRFVISSRVLKDWDGIS